MTVPAALIRPYVLEFVDDPIPAPGQPLPALTTLATKTALSYDTIQRVWAGTTESLQFDVADRILCAVNAVQAWFREPLRQIYTQHALPEIVPPRGRCQRRGCTASLPPKKQPGGQPRKYCSRTCRDAASRARCRDKIRTGRYSNPLDRCVHGHDWSPENTYVSPQGKRLCRQCMRDNQAQQRRRARQRLAAA